jgi:mRNA interferase MazF
VGHEQGLRRPALVVSNDGFNTSGYGLHVVVPLTTKEKGLETHVFVRPPEVPAPSWIRCEDVRGISIVRFGGYIRRVSESTYAAVREHLRRLLDL